MMPRAAAIAIASLLLAAPVALAQASGPEAIDSSSGGVRSMAALLSEGYEIRASVPNGTKFIVFMQKEKSAYACEFVTLTRSRCGSIN